jgi:hypothetical protein
MHFKIIALQGTPMAKNHYSTKAKRRNRSGKHKDTQRIADNMAKIRTLELAGGTQKKA